HAAQVLLSGGCLYRDFIDMNGPGGPYLHAFSQALIGSSDLHFRCFDLLWMIGTYGVLYLLARRCLRPFLAGGLLLVHASFYTGIGWWHTGQRDSFALLSFLGLGLLLHRGLTDPKTGVWPWLGAGLFLGKIFCLRPPSLVLVPLLVGVVGTPWAWTQPPPWRQRRTALRWLTLGAAILPLLVAGHLAWHGALLEGWEQVRFLGGAYYDYGSLQQLWQNLGAEIGPMWGTLRRDFPVLVLFGVVGASTLLSGTRGGEN